jgi:hypothetical protein
VTTTPTTPEPTLTEIFDQLARTNATNGSTARIAAGTFALYPDAGGAVVLVLNVDEGPEQLRGTLRKKIGPAMIRALDTFAASGGGVGGVFKALVPRRKGRPALPPDYEVAARVEEQAWINGDTE